MFWYFMNFINSQDSFYVKYRKNYRGCSVKKKCSYKFRIIYRKPLCWILFLKTQVFSCEYFEIYKYLLWSASANDCFLKYF